MNTYITEKEAQSRGMHPLAGPYRSDEMWMMANVVNDLSWSGCEYAIVLESGGLSVWRTGMSDVRES